MNGFHQDIDVLLSLQSPTNNRITDYFGYHRHWGKRTWTPDAGYAPIHAGIDYSAMPNRYISAPCDCLAWGDKIAGPVGSYIMMRPILADGSESKYIALYFFHCEPTPRLWGRYTKGDAITTQAGYGIGQDHLHFEIVLAKPLGQELVSMGILHEDWITLKQWHIKAAMSGLNKQRSILAVQKQMQDWQIRGMYNDYYIRATLPEYRKSQYSEVGNYGAAYVVDPTLFISPG